MSNNRKNRKEILKLEKQMQKSPNQQVILTLAEKYTEIGEPHQAVAVLIEGIQAHPESATLKVICARFMLMYQTDEITKAENLIKNVLVDHPDNLMAQQLLEQIHTQVETMHEIPDPFHFDTSELQKQATMKYPSPSGSQGSDAAVDAVWDDSQNNHGEALAEAFKLYQEGALDAALEIIQGVLEEDPENSDARESFRLIYAEKFKDQDELDLDDQMAKKLEVIRRTLHFLEVMKDVAHSRKEEPSND